MAARAIRHDPGAGHNPVTLRIAAALVLTLGFAEPAAAQTVTRPPQGQTTQPAVRAPPAPIRLPQNRSVDAGTLSIVGQGDATATVAVNAGTLSVIGQGANAGSAQVSVNAGALSVVGLGADAGTAQVNINAGTLSVVGAN